MNPYHFSLTVSLLVMRVSAKCSEAQTEASTTMFKDCMDEKEAALLEMEVGPEEDFAGSIDLSSAEGDRPCPGGKRGCMPYVQTLRGEGCMWARSEVGGC